MSVSPLLTAYLTEQPSEMVKLHQANSKLYCAAAIVSAIGALTIFGGITAVYLGLISSTSLSTSAALTTIFSGCLFSHGVSVFSQWRTESLQLITWYERLGTQLQSIQNWSPGLVQDFFCNRQVVWINLSATALCRGLNPQHPEFALLPLIARYQLTELYAHAWEQKASEQTAALQKIDRLPAEARERIRTIHLALAASANREKQRCEQLNAELLHLLML